MNKRYYVILLIGILLSGCTAPGYFKVTKLGYEPSEIQSTRVYNLPRTSLKVTLYFEQEIFVPGPYADYAQRLLGIEGVKKERVERYIITGAGMESVIEPDPEMFFSLNVLEGQPDLSVLENFMDQGLVFSPGTIFDQDIDVQSAERKDDIMYKDVTMESNMEMRTETIYKTLITDTSFVRVPVTTEQMEMKTIGRKAEEAAKLILEIRSDRYYVAAGLIDPFPDNFDMRTSLNGLDKLEEAYLSLFIGKSYTQRFVKEYYIVPAGIREEEIFELDKFSPKFGLSAVEGDVISIRINTVGRSASFRNLLPQEPEEQAMNRVYYRIPETCEVYLRYGEELLSRKRTSIYQYGALVSELVKSE